MDLPRAVLSTEVEPAAGLAVGDELTDRRVPRHPDGLQLRVLGGHISDEPAVDRPAHEARSVEPAKLRAREGHPHRDHVEPIDEGAAGEGRLVGLESQDADLLVIGDGLVGETIDRLRSVLVEDGRLVRRPGFRGGPGLAAGGRIASAGSEERQKDGREDPRSHR